MTVGVKPLDDSERVALEKSEVLILDRDEQAREEMAEALQSAGIIVTSSGEPARALQLAGEKYFSVILLDIDTPKYQDGYKLIIDFQKASPASSLILIAQKPTFDVAVRGFRAGASDVVDKSPGQNRQLVESVFRLSLETKIADQRTLVLREALEMHEDLLKRLIEEYRKARIAEESVSGQSDSSGMAECKILVVDDNPRTAPGLLEALGGGKALFGCVAALNGGEALDYAGTCGFDIALVKQTLPDLSGTMVASTLKSQSSDAIVLLFSHPGGQQPGSVKIIEKGQTVDLVPNLHKASQLVSSIKQLRDARTAKAREKKYLQAFRQEHMDFLRRYVEYRQKILKLLPGEGE